METCLLRLYDRPNFSKNNDTLVKLIYLFYHVGVTTGGSIPFERGVGILFL